MTEPTTETMCIAFDGPRRIAAGRLADVAMAVKVACDQQPDASILIFDDVSSRTIELDLRGDADAVLMRIAQTDPAKPQDTESASETPVRRGPGRPKLGVVAREVTLLPRHWSWLAEQPGSASVTLRKLVEQARRASTEVDQRRRAQEAAYRFMNAIAGNEPGYEEAMRALYADEEEAFRAYVASWPVAVRDHAITLAQRAFAAGGDACKT